MLVLGTQNLVGHASFVWVVVTCMVGACLGDVFVKSEKGNSSVCKKENTNKARTKETKHKTKIRWKKMPATDRGDGHEVHLKKMPGGMVSLAGRRRKGVHCLRGKTKDTQPYQLQDAWCEVKIVILAKIVARRQYCILLEKWEEEEWPPQPEG